MSTKYLAAKQNLDSFLAQTTQFKETHINPALITAKAVSSLQLEATIKKAQEMWTDCHSLPTDIKTWMMQNPRQTLFNISSTEGTVRLVSEAFHPEDLLELGWTGTGPNAGSLGSVAEALQSLFRNANKRGKPAVKSYAGALMQTATTAGTKATKAFNSARTVVDWESWDEGKDMSTSEVEEDGSLQHQGRMPSIDEWETLEGEDAEDEVLGTNEGDDFIVLDKATPLGGSGFKKQNVF